MKSFIATIINYLFKFSLHKKGFSDLDEEFFQCLYEKMNDNRLKIAFIQGEKKISFEELIREVDEIAGALASYIQPGEIIGFLGDISLRSIPYLLAVVKLGGIYMPIPSEYSLSRQKEIIKLACPSLVLSFSTDELIHDLCNIPCFSVSTGIYHQGVIKKSSPLDKAALYVIFTSGSTGKPKGVVGTKKGLLNRLKWFETAFPFSNNECLCQKASSAFVDHIAEIFQPIFSAQPCLIVPQPTVRDVSLFCSTIKLHKISRITLVPTYLRLLTQLPGSELEKLRSLELVISSGEVLSTHLASKVKKLLNWIRLINIYGTSEVSADVTFYEWQDDVKEEINPFFSESSSESQLYDEKIIAALHTQNHVNERTSNYDAYLDERIPVFANTVNVTKKTYLGHMTSPIPNYLPKLAKKLVTLNQNLVKVETSGSFTFLEREIIAKLHREFYCNEEKFYDQFIRSKEKCLGVCLNGGTLGNIQALRVASLHSIQLNGIQISELDKVGFNEILQTSGYRKAVIVASPMVHYSCAKALTLFGLGKESVIHTELNPNGALCVNSLKKIIHRCRKDNIFILSVIGIAGTTENGVIDPLDEIASICEQSFVHFHVDAAWGGGMIFSAKMRMNLKGIEKADSISLCGHKLFYTPQGLSLVLYKNFEIGAFLSFHARYQARADSYDLGKFSILGSKPANSLFLDANLSILGKKGLRYLTDRSCELAFYFAQLVNQSAVFELLKFPETNIINYRYIPERYRNQSIITKQQNREISLINESLQKELFLKQKGFVSYTQQYTNSQFIGVLRAVICNPMIEEEDLVNILNIQIRLANEILKEDIPPLKPFALSRSTCVPIGYPIENTEIEILNSAGKLCEIGEAGEICVVGTSISLGYIDQLRKTGKRSSQTRVFTGDIGRWNPRGFIEYLGRKDRLVKINGMQVNLLEYSLIINTLPEVENSWIEEIDNQLILFYISNKEGELALASLDLFIKPHKVVKLKKLPLLPSGKINTQQLRQDFINQQKLWDKPSTFSHTFSKKDLIKIFQSLLKVEDVLLDTNFFDMGCDSIKINELIILLKTHHDIHLSVAQAFQFSTINKLYCYLSKKLHSNNLVKKPTFSTRLAAIRKRQDSLKKRKELETNSSQKTSC